MAKREKKDVMVQESALARFLKRVGSKVLSVRQDVVIDSASRREQHAQTDAMTDSILSHCVETLRKGNALSILWETAGKGFIPLFAFAIDGAVKIGIIKENGQREYGSATNILRALLPEAFVAKDNDAAMEIASRARFNRRWERGVPRGQATKKDTFLISLPSGVYGNLGIVAKAYHNTPPSSPTN